MKPFHFYALGIVAVAATLLLGGHAMAQSTQDMSLLSDQERLAFRERLQMVTTSAGRAKITAEMNRLVQERRIDLELSQGRDGQLANTGAKHSD